MLVTALRETTRGEVGSVETSQEAMTVIQAKAPAGWGGDGENEPDTWIDLEGKAKSNRTFKFSEECEKRGWRQPAFLRSFLQRGTKMLAVVPGAKRVKRIYLRMGGITAHCNAGERGKKKKLFSKNRIINHSTDDNAGEM